MKISIFGLGYVGSVTGACMANSGHQIVGVDVNTYKLRLLRNAQSPVMEPGLPEIIKAVVREGRLTVTSSPTRAVCATDLSIICVGTPSNHNGSIDLGALEKVARQIGAGLKKKASYHLIVNRSTVLPGTTEELVIPALETTSGKRADRDFGVCVNPEFLREGSSVEDFYNPPLVVIGASDQRSGNQLEDLYRRLRLAAPLHTTTIRVAEFLKYACNLFHAAKIVFANELGNIAKKIGIDSHELMRIFCADRKLNISPSYLKPGFAFGGSCLPKDIKALAYKAKQLDLDVPLISSLLFSNQIQIRVAFEMIRRTEKKSVGILGLSFKSNTDDLRESPTVELVEMLIGKGYRVIIYDEEVSMSRLIGANKQYIQTTVPHLSKLFETDLNRLIRRSDVLVMTKNSARHKSILRSIPKDKILIDLVRIDGDVSVFDKSSYNGICW